MPFEVKIKTTAETKRFLREFPKLTRKGLIEGMRKAMTFATDESKKSFGTRDHLHSRTGQLQRSIRSKVNAGSTTISGSLLSDVIYAKIHEEGGTIRPRAGSYLTFQVNGNWVKVPSVRIKARPFLRPAIEENLKRLEDILIAGILKKVD